MSKDFGKKFFLGVSVENAETLNPAGQGLPSNLSVRINRNRRRPLQLRPHNYSFNYTPDFVVKMAVEPGWGHWELFGIGRSFRDRIYPSRVSATCTVPTTAHAR